ncbi:MAG: hypothetical protein EZS28_039420 [Streblomastix strix]|uniref:Uncharacterized protein n=1 Tax=Streblomastix strix TaxID=222440 RepID=A0A5J4U446_9EUKA|nr:MAG: hypothetical protein EZS28_039420 [Streblomastix strix]
MIYINSGKTALNSFSAIGITLYDESLISYSITGNLNIEGCIFTNIQNTITNGNGGVINGRFSSTSGSILIKGTDKTSFTSCTVPSDSGLGGIIYIDIQTGGELKYDLTSASYFTESVSIDNSQFDNILRTTSDDTISQVGGTIEATIGGSSGQLTILKTKFSLYLSQQSQQAGGISLTIKEQRTVSVSQTSFIQCESDLGSGINAQILSG